MALNNKAMPSNKNKKGKTSFLEIILLITALLELIKIIFSFFIGK
jgi:hypothetical protein